MGRLQDRVSAVVAILRAPHVTIGARIKLAGLEIGSRLLHRTGRQLPRWDIELALRGGLAVLLRGPTLHVDYLTFVDIFVDRSFAFEIRRPVVIDAGGHRGYFGAYALTEGALAVHSLEPASDNRETLERTAASARKLGYRWAVDPCALGAENGEADLRLSTESWAHSLRLPEGKDTIGRERVRVRTLGSVVSDVRDAAADPLVVKLNIEGLAGEVILATPKEVWQEVEEVLFDYEPDTPEPLDGLLAHLAVAGLTSVGGNGRCYRISRPSPT